MERTRLAILFLFSISLLSVSKAKDEATKTALYIVEVEKPEGIQLEAFYLKTLSAVLGSVEAAKEALIYSYKYAIYGFAAQLTQKQALEISSKFEDDKERFAVTMYPSWTTKLSKKWYVIHFICWACCSLVYV
ncbi:subtilisin-like protease SBT3.5 [Elaeis guineensis]|uniref:subtilisin-like protease SBT3.5 n=1 Tax=Elaeis guineensis var. tenera TaxID=51953 RepID=UPI003C6D6ED8